MKTLLKTEVQELIKEIKSMEVGSDEHRAAVDSLTKLVDRIIELEKLEVEAENRDTDRANENYYRELEMKSNRKDRIIKDVITVAGIVVPATLAIWGTFVTLEFEKEGVVTTTAGKIFISKLFPKK